jgi:hypothetical protein
MKRLNPRGGETARRRQRSHGFVTLGLTGTVIAGSLAATFGIPNHSRLLNLLDGHGWVTNNRDGTALFANGSSGQVDLKVAFPGSGHKLTVVLSGNQPTVYDSGRQPTLSTVSLQSGNVVSTNSVQRDDDVVPSNNVLFLVNRASGVVEALNPATNAVLGHYQFQSSTSSAVATPDGSLFVVPLSTGTLAELRVTGGRLKVVNEVPVASRNDEVQLGLFNGTLEVLDVTAGTLASVSGDAENSIVHLRAPKGGSLVLPASASGPVLPIAVSHTSTIDLVRGSQVSTVHLPLASTFGSAVTFGNRLYLPVLHSGEVLVLGDDGSEVRGPIVLGGNHDTVDVYEQGGYLWLNNPNGGLAFAVSRQGTLRSIDKNPARVPTKRAQPSEHPKPPNPSPPPPNPTQSNPTTPGPPPLPPPQHKVHPQAPDPPRAVDATGTNGAAGVTWQFAVANGSRVVSYLVSVVGAKSAAKTSGLGYTVSGLTNGHWYSFAVSAVDALGQVSVPAFSKKVEATSRVPGASTAVQATADDHGAVNLSWQRVPNTTGYPISYYEIYANGKYVASTTDARPDYTVSTLNSALQLGQDYSFAVKAVSSNGAIGRNSPPSGTVLVEAEPTGVSLDTPTLPATGDLSLTWTCDSLCSGGLSPSFTVAAADTTSGLAGTASAPAFRAPDTYTATITGLPGPGVGPWTVTVTVKTSLGSEAAITSSNVVEPPTVTITPSLTNDSPPGDSGRSSITPSQDQGMDASIVVSINSNDTPIMACSLSYGQGSTACSTERVSNQSFSEIYSTWNTPYTVTVTLTVGTGYSAAPQSVVIPATPKPLTVDAAPWFVTCPGTYCGGNAHSEPTPNFVSGTGTVQDEGTAVYAMCQTSGGSASGNAGGSPSPSTWVELANETNPYMSILWFANVSGTGSLDANAALPGC